MATAEARARAAPRRAPERPRVAAAPRRGRRTAAGPGVALGVVWIGLVAVLLTGVVALNVAVLRLNVRIDELGRERVELRARNATLASQVSSAVAAGRIDAIAREELGLVPAPQTSYVDLSRPAK